MQNLEKIKERLMNTSLAGWDCYHDESAESITIRFGNSFIELPAGALFKISFDPNTAEFIKNAPQDMMNLIDMIEEKL